MAIRSTRQQSKHDKEVTRIADYYQRQGYKVKADVKEFEQPKVIQGRRPDVVAKRDGNTVLVEVETPDSLKNDKAQRETFENFADGKKNVKFRLKIAK